MHGFCDLKLTLTADEHVASEILPRKTTPITMQERKMPEFYTNRDKMQKLTTVYEMNAFMVSFEEKVSLWLANVPIGTLASKATRNLCKPLQRLQNCKKSKGPTSVLLPAP